jgi:CheY-like chemotaxis protein
VEARESRSLRILIVDDNRGFADSLATLVRSRGHEAFVAYRAIDGLQMASDVLPELVFHDIELPDMDGYEAARRLRRDSRFKKTLLVAVTGNDAPAIVESTRVAGYDRFIPKPMDYAAMVDALHAVEAGHS